MVVKKIPPSDKAVFNASEACGYIGLCWNTLKKYIEEGDIKAIKVGKRRYLIAKSSLDEFLKKDELYIRALIKGIR